jgi:hypothetical protein
MKMFLKKSNKVPAIKYINAIIILTLLVFNGNVHCSDSNSVTSEGGSHNTAQRRVASGSGSGASQLEKQRSSYAVISQAFSDTVNNEFGSKCI